MIVALQALLLFRKSLINIIDRFLGPYVSHFLFTKKSNVQDDEDNDDEVFAEFDSEKGVVFYPPVYAQRYAAVSDCLLDKRWHGKLEKVVDFGCNDLSFIKYLKDISGVKEILGVDLDTVPISCSSDLRCDKYVPKRENPLKITVLEGNAADPDYRLIGCDAVVAIEMIEHMQPHDLDRFVHNVFGFIKPWITIITTPNGDFNVLFKALAKNGLRRLDHMFEWTREQFNDWCSNIVARYPDYDITCRGIGPGPIGTSHLGCCSQLALFVAKDYHKQQDLNLNSLAVVTHDSYSDYDSDLTESWDSPYPIGEKNMLCAPNRLNCTTLQVKKFSKTTQNLMAKNKIDALVHTKEVVDEIKQLSKILNLKKNCLEHYEKGYIWYNINWGEKAPYWNQYYKVVQEYKYPYEVKSRESRILELISEEINRLIDEGKEEEFVNGVDKMEIPIEFLMNALKHITDDEVKVRELLEWNGYEVVNDVVVYSRLVVDDLSEDVNEDWEELDSMSDWTSSDGKSTTISEGALIERDLYDRGLRRAVDVKIRNLRRLSAQEDIATELDRVVCRLLKLALGTHRSHETPLPSSWMLYKLYDLLTLTENALLKRKKCFMKHQNKPIDYDMSPGIVKNYENDWALKSYDNDNENYIIYADKESQNITLIDTNEGNAFDQCNTVIPNSKPKLLGNQVSTLKVNISKVITNVTGDKSNPNFLQYEILDYHKFKFDIDGKEKEYDDLLAKISQPIIPDIDIASASNYTDLQIDTDIGRHFKELGPCLNDYKLSKVTALSNTEDSVFLNIITDCAEETITFCRSIGTDPVIIPDTLDIDANTETNSKVLKIENSTSCHEFETENKDSSMFIYDINEPSTSEGVRHFSADAECGPDISTSFMTFENTPSTARMPKRCKTGIWIGDSETNLQFGKEFQDFGTITETIEKISEHTNSFIDYKNHTPAPSIDDTMCDVTKSKQSFNSTLTQIIKPSFSVTHIEESSSKMSDRTDSFLKLPKQISDRQSSWTSKESECPIIHVKPKLSIGGIYVHSYKDRWDAEDIVYQGEWQKCYTTSKVVLKKNIFLKYNRVNRKVPKKMTGSKEATVKSVIKETQKTHKNPVMWQNPKSINAFKKPKPKIQEEAKIAFLKSYTKSNLQPVTAKFRRRKNSVTQVTSKTITRCKPIICSKKPSKTSTPIKVPRENTDVNNLNNYIPLYIQKRKLKLLKNKNIISDSNIKSKIKETIKTTSASNLLKKDIVKRRLFNYAKDIHQNRTIYVYRNDVNSQTINKTIEPECSRNFVPSSFSNRRQSCNSSPCSSPDSIVTVRDVCILDKKDNKSISQSKNTCEFKNSMHKTKNILKKINTSPVGIKDNRENKENISETVRKLEIKIKDTLLKQNRNTHPSKASIDTQKPTILASCENKFQASMKSSAVPQNVEIIKETEIKTNKTFNALPGVSDKSSKEISFKVVSKISNKAIKFSNNDAETNTSKCRLDRGNYDDQSPESVEIDMNKIIKEKLSNKECGRHNKLQNINVNTIKPHHLEAHIKTYTTEKCVGNEVQKLFQYSNIENESKLSVDLENIQSTTFPANLGSPQSFASISASKVSEYFLANNELGEDFFLQIKDLALSSIQANPEDKQKCEKANNEDKENCELGQDEARPLQVVRGRSSEHFIINDQSDQASYIDCETGSRALVTTHTISDDLLLSERSSENTYESCTLDEDIYVPNWLFELDEPEPPVPPLVRLPAIEPEMEISAMEVGLNVAAGAGDGKGMHSDHSQESSDDGTSLSSSRTSSVQESQDFVSDASAFADTIDYVQEPAPNARVFSNESLDITIEGIRERWPTTPIIPAMTSDNDGDVSSFDTDAIESD